MDPGRIEAAITPRTKAILPVHVFGRPCDMQAILRIARRYHLTVIEDACEALGARVRGRPAGTLGQTGVLAFYPNKQMTTGEGGMILTNDEEVARLCRSWRNQGRGEDGTWLQHARLGYNYRLSDINCALGIAQLHRLPDMLQARRWVAGFYAELLQNMPGVIAPRQEEPHAEISWFVYVVRLEDSFTREDRDRILATLKAHHIGCNNYFTPIHLQPFYQASFGFAPGDFPLTEKVSERTIALPFFNRLRHDTVTYICSHLRRAIEATRRRGFAAFPAAPVKAGAAGQV
jgi:perosamine synthetase